MASKGINKVILIGNLGNNPDVRATAVGQTITTVSLATSDSWKDKNTGQTQEKTEWHRVVVFGKLAEFASQMLKKGSKVYFEGKLQTRKWQDKSGQDRYTTEIIVDSFTGVMQVLDPKEKESSHQSDTQKSEPMAPVSNPVPIDDKDFDVPW